VMEESNMFSDEADMIRIAHIALEACKAGIWWDKDGTNAFDKNSKPIPDPCAYKGSLDDFRASLNGGEMVARSTATPSMQRASASASRSAQMPSKRQRAAKAIEEAKSRATCVVIDGVPDEWMSEVFVKAFLEEIASEIWNSCKVSTIQSGDDKKLVLSWDSIDAGAVAATWCAARFDGRKCGPTVIDARTAEPTLRSEQSKQQPLRPCSDRSTPSDSELWKFQ
jgi:hypothetical protein